MRDLPILFTAPIKMLENRYGHHHPDWQKEAAEV